MAKRTNINPVTEKRSSKVAIKPASKKAKSKAGSKSAGQQQPAATSGFASAANSRTAKSVSRGTSKKPAKAARTSEEKLNSVTPSGRKDQTFFELVFEVTRQIPKGRVTSYGAIAASLGAGSSSRLVGWAMNLAGGAKPKVPAHRVVNRNGMLSGKHHFATPTQMQELLEKEGVKVKNDKVVDFKKHFWDPMDVE